MEEWKTLKKPTSMKVERVVVDPKTYHKNLLRVSQFPPINCDFGIRHRDSASAVKRHITTKKTLDKEA